MEPDEDWRGLIGSRVRWDHIIERDVDAIGRGKHQRGHSNDDLEDAKRSVVISVRLSIAL